MAEIKEEYKFELIRLFGNQLTEDYGECMSALSTSQRKTLLQPYLIKARVNWGHIAIAAMMKSDYIGRVLTFNFDSVLARACGLLGIYPATYDYSQSDSDRTDHISERSIIHLHGQGHSLTMLNSNKETQKHAKNLKPLLKDTLNRTPVLIAGYSGKSDAVFDVLANLYDRTHFLHWIGYSEDCDQHVADLISENPETCEYLGEADSDLFFIELAQELGCWPPLLFTNPYAHLIQEIDPVTPHPGSDTDILTELKRGLEELSNEKDKSSDTLKLILEGKWDEVINNIGDQPIKTNQKKLLAVALTSKADFLRSRVSDRVDESTFDEAQELYKRSVKLDPEFHRAYNNWGNLLQRSGTHFNKPKLIRDSFDKYRKAVSLNQNHYEAITNWGNALSALARQNKSEELYVEALKKYEEASLINSRKYQAFSNWGAALYDYFKLTNDLKKLMLSIEKYETAIKISPSSHVVYNNWGIALKAYAISLNDISLYQESFVKFSKAIEIKPNYTKALNNWGSAVIGLFKTTGEKKLLGEAKRILEKSQGQDPSDVYNLACLYAQMGKRKKCIKTLLQCESVGTLPSLQHLKTDGDLDSLREHAEFKALLARLAASEHGDI